MESKKTIGVSGDGGNITGYDARSGARAKIRALLYDIRCNGYSTRPPFAIGRVERRMFEYANRNGITLASKSMYFSAKGITHAMRSSKMAKGLVITENEFVNFPNSRKTMDLFYDGKNFIYTDYNAKFIVHPNYELKIKGKKTTKVNLVTAGRVTNPSEFLMKKYRKI